MIVSNLRFLALVLLLTVVSMFFDYVKIGLVTGARKKVLQETWLTLKFVGRRFFRAWGLYLLAGLVFVALTLLYLEVARVLPKNRPLLVLLFSSGSSSTFSAASGARCCSSPTELELVKQHRRNRSALSDT